MRPTTILLATVALALAACVAGPPRPSEVRLTHALLTVRMSDGSTCLGPAPQDGAETGWSGRLQGCDSGYSHAVEIAPGANPLRFALEEVLGAVGLEDALAPMATVTIIGADGTRRRFVSPPPRVD